MKSSRNHRKSGKPPAKRKKRQFYNIEPLGPDILRQYPGKFIVYSEDEKRVIGVGDTEAEAFDQAESRAFRDYGIPHTQPSLAYF
jgi:hypothetical protein